MDIQELKTLAEGGDAKSQKNLGNAYQDGLGVKKDYVKAVEWYQKAAEQGYAEAQCILGAHYVQGKGVEQDYVKAVDWYRKAAEQGYEKAKQRLKKSGNWVGT